MTTRYDQLARLVESAKTRHPDDSGVWAAADAVGAIINGNLADGATPFRECLEPVHSLPYYLWARYACADKEAELRLALVDLDAALASAGDAELAETTGSQQDASENAVATTDNVTTPDLATAGDFWWDRMPWWGKGLVVLFVASQIRQLSK